jgi:hypothetical protein
MGETLARLIHTPAAWRYTGGLALLYAGMALALWLLGRHFLTDSGFGLWTGAWTPHTSQWVADPYTFTHVLHGFLFYWALLPLRHRLPIGARFMTASVIEAAWEIVENTPYVIERYRDATASLEYTGDSILNSSFDLAAAQIGFLVAWKLPWKWVLGLLVAIEVLLALLIRDNLTLNVLMLLFPLEAVKEWQTGG